MNEIPNIIFIYGIDYDWDEKDVWKIDCPIEELDINKLTWHLELPFWDYNGKNYVVTPNEVLKNPDKYHSHYNRIVNCDLAYPIDVLENKGRLVILDGLHRLAKYQLLNKDKVKVRIIPQEEFLGIAHEEK